MKFKLVTGAEVDVLNKAELSEALKAHSDAEWRDLARGVKYFRLQRMSGTVASSAVTIGGSASVQQAGPDQGFAWSVRRLSVAGLTTGGTPDILNLFRNEVTSDPPVWQFNGNNFAYTFGALELVLMPGEQLLFKNSGTIAATGSITVTGDAVEVPAEMLWKLI